MPSPRRTGEPRQIERGLPLGPAYEVVDEADLRWAIRCLAAERPGLMPQPAGSRSSVARPRDGAGRRPPRRR